MYKVICCIQAHSVLSEDMVVSLGAWRRGILMEGFPGGVVGGKDLLANSRRQKSEVDPWVRKDPLG